VAVRGAAISGDVKHKHRQQPKIFNFMEVLGKRGFKSGLLGFKKRAAFEGSGLGKYFTAPPTP
jgi:hypothetical protein